MIFYRYAWGKYNTYDSTFNRKYNRKCNRKYDRKYIPIMRANKVNVHQYYNQQVYNLIFESHLLNCLMVWNGALPLIQVIVLRICFMVGYRCNIAPAKTF